MTRQEYHYACCLLSPCQQQAGSYNPVVPAPRNRQADRKSFSGISGISLRLSVSAHGVPANVAYAHHDNNRNVPDEWSMKLSKVNLFPCKKETDEGE